MFSGEPCKMDNGTAGICMFDKYCKRNPHEHVINTRPCQAYEVNCCLRRSVSAIKSVDQPTTITRTAQIDKMSGNGHHTRSHKNGYPATSRPNIYAAKTSKPFGDTSTN